MTIKKGGGMKKRKRIIVLGLMSGTSADGLSIAVVDVSSAKGEVEVLKYKTYSYSSALQNKILSASNMKAFELSELSFELGRLWAKYVKKFCLANNFKYGDISAIGSHGQTICHNPFSKIPNTLQIGEASFIAEETGVPVVCDFRPMDMAVGGQGAPLIPFLDDFMFSGGKSKILLNIGGIANFSIAGKGIETFGFDTGPGNCLMDAFIGHMTKGKIKFDRNGALAQRGMIDYKKIERMLKERFFKMKPPKSADRNDFSILFIRKHFGRLNNSDTNDILATLNYFTAKSIEVSIRRFAGRIPSEMIVSGGGVFNLKLMENLKNILHPVKISIVAEPLAKEPACFALLAWRAVNGKINHPYKATGAKNKRILGKIILQRGSAKARK